MFNAASGADYGNTSFSVGARDGPPDRYCVMRLQQFSGAELCQIIGQQIFFLPSCPYVALVQFSLVLLFFHMARVQQFYSFGQHRVVG